MLGRLIIVFGIIFGIFCLPFCSFAEEQIDKTKETKRIDLKEVKAKDPYIALKIEVLNLRKKFKIEQIKNAMLRATIQVWNDPEFQEYHRELRETDKQLKQLTLLQ